MCFNLNIYAGQKWGLIFCFSTNTEFLLLCFTYDILDLLCSPARTKSQVMCDEVIKFRAYEYFGALQEYMAEV